MYQWPRARMLRTVMIVMALGITADLVWNGAWPQFGAYFDPATSNGLKLFNAISYSLMAVVALVGGIFAIGYYPISAQFLIDVEDEMYQVTWPSRGELAFNAVLIAGIIAVLSFVIFGVDQTTYQLIHNQLFRLGGAS